jgi:hypothetical protein
MRLQIDVPELFRLWTSGVPHAEICERLGIPQGSLWRVRDHYKLPPRMKVIPRCDRDEDDPTPEEIAERTAAIRAKWTPEETERRIVGPRPSAYRIPNYRFSRRTMSYAAALET